MKTEVIENKEMKEVQLGPKTFTAPKGWKKREVSEVCENLDSDRDPIKSSNREPGGIPYYGATGCVDYVNDYIFDEKLLLIGEDGADWSRFAKTAYGIEGKSWVNNHAHVLRCAEITDKYLEEFLNYQDLRYTIVGTNRGKLNKKALMGLEVLYPPLPEQKKVAEVLSTVDEAIEKTDEIIEATQELKRGLMQDLLVKGIGHDEFKEVQLGPKKIKIPIGWNYGYLDKLLKNTRYGLNTSVNKASGDYVLRVTDVSSNGEINDESLKCADLDEDEKDKYKLELHDLVIARSGATSGKVSIYEGQPNDLFFSSYMIKMEPGERIHGKYLFYILNSDFGQGQLMAGKQGSAQSNINTNSIERTGTPVPPLSEQKKIANILSTVDEKIQKEKEYKKTLKDLKKGLMQDLLTGQVRVTDLIEN